MKSILLYNLYPRNHWKELTNYLLEGVPHDSIVVNVSLDWKDALFKKRQIISFLHTIPKVTQIFTSKNVPALAEGIGFENMRQHIDFTGISMLTYMHSKGVTKPGNRCISDWVELMRYYHINRHELCLQVFNQGYSLYGVNLGLKEGDITYGPYEFSDFHYSGNFVSVNLETLRDAFINTPIDQNYFGVEGFWGKLCSYKQAYCAHKSSPAISNHYRERYPESLYKA